MNLASRYFAHRYFAPRYFGTRGQVAVGGEVSVIRSGVVLPFVAPRKTFSARSDGGLEWGGCATIVTRRTVLSNGGLEWGGLADTTTIRLVQAQGEMSWAGIAPVATSISVLANGGIKLEGESYTIIYTDRWSKARAEEELWLLMI